MNIEELETYTGFYEREVIPLIESRQYGQALNQMQGILLFLNANSFNESQTGTTNSINTTKAYLEAKRLEKELRERENLERITNHSKQLLINLNELHGKLNFLPIFQKC